MSKDSELYVGERRIGTVDLVLLKAQYELLQNIVGELVNQHLMQLHEMELMYALIAMIGDMLPRKGE